MPRLVVASLFLLLASPAAASSAADLTGSWLGRLGCEDGAFKLSLRVSPVTGRWALTYALSGIGGTAGKLSGLGTLEPDGRLSLSRPVPNPLLPDQMPAILLFDPEKPSFTGRTDLGAFESAAGATADCAFAGKNARFSCAVDWHLLRQESHCALRLVKDGARDSGPLACPEGLSGTRAGGFLHCAPARKKT